MRPLLIAAYFSGKLIFPFEALYTDFGINFDKALFNKN